MLRLFVLLLAATFMLPSPADAQREPVPQRFSISPLVGVAVPAGAGGTFTEHDDARWTYTLDYSASLALGLEGAATIVGPLSAVGTFAYLTRSDVDLHWHREGDGEPGIAEDIRGAETLIGALGLRYNFAEEPERYHPGRITGHVTAGPTFMREMYSGTEDDLTLRPAGDDDSIGLMLEAGATFELTALPGVELALGIYDFITQTPQIWEGPAERHSADLRHTLLFRTGLTFRF